MLNKIKTKLFKTNKEINEAKLILIPLIIYAMAICVICIMSNILNLFSSEKIDGFICGFVLYFTVVYAYVSFLDICKYKNEYDTIASLVTDSEMSMRKSSDSDESMTRIREIIADWKKEVGIRNYEVVAIHKCNDTLFIITQKPGYFIGKRGVLVDKYQKILKDNGYDLRIHFVDIFCGNVKVF